MRIALSGGLYPLVAGAALWLPIASIALATWVSRAEADWGKLLFGAVNWAVAPIVYVPAMFAAASIYTALVTIITLPAIAESLWLAGVRLAADRAGSLAGGAVAWCALAPVGVALGDSAGCGCRTPFDWLWWAGTLFCALGVPVGMAAGSLAGASALRRSAQRANRSPALHLRRLSLRALLALIAPLSVGLAIAQAFGELTPRLAIYAAFGVASVMLLRKPVRWTVNAWLGQVLRRRQQRRGVTVERST